MENGLRVVPELTVVAKTLLNLDEVGRALDPGFDPNDALRRNAARLIQQRLLQAVSPAHVFSSVLETKDFVHIGNTNLFNASPENRSAELGVMIGEKEYWSRGFGTDALTTLARFGFDGIAQFERLVVGLEQDLVLAGVRLGFHALGVSRGDSALRGCDALAREEQVLRLGPTVRSFLRQPRVGAQCSERAVLAEIGVDLAVLQIAIDRTHPEHRDIMRALAERTLPALTGAPPA